MGIDDARLDVLFRRVQLEVERGPLPSAQVAVAHAGNLVAFETFGDATRQSRYILQSVGRSVVACVAWKLLDDGLLALDEAVADVIPEFAANGKAGIKVRHVLTHTAGLALAPLGYPKMLSRQARLAAFARWRPDHAPGAGFQYHLTSAAWILAELTERRTGVSFPEYLRTRIVEPLGLGFILPVPADRYHELVAVPVVTDRTADAQVVDPWGPWYLADPDVLAAGEPSHSLVGTAADMAMLFQHINHSGLWSDDIVVEATRPHVSLAPAGDTIYGGSGRVTNMGLFVTVSGDDPGLWVPATGSPRTWGNGGAPCQLAFYDPESDASFAFLTNGYPLSGYDRTRMGANRIINIANLGNDLVV